MTAYTWNTDSQRMKKMKRVLLTTSLSLLSLATASVFAAEGYVTGNVNLRAGPDTSYPSVTRLHAGTTVEIMGCVDGWAWCDVSSGYDRGWMAGDYLQEEYEGRRVLVPSYGVQIDIPIVSFVFADYWNDHYRQRSWYANREHWSHVQPQYRSTYSHADSHDSHPDSHANSVAHHSGAPLYHDTAPTGHADVAPQKSLRTTAQPALTQQERSRDANASDARHVEHNNAPAAASTHHVAAQPTAASSGPNHAVD